MNHANSLATKQPTAGDPLGVRENEIPARTATAEAQVSYLHDTISSLVSRLESVLQPASEGEAVGDPVPPSLTALGDRLLDIGNRTRRANERLQDILRRLEV